MKKSIFLKTFCRCSSLSCFQETVCCTMTECSSVRTTMTTIIGRVTVDLFIEGRGGIKLATIPILTGSSLIQILAKGSFGTIGKVLNIKWRKSEGWFENPRVESIRVLISQARNGRLNFFWKDCLVFVESCIYVCI